MIATTDRKATCGSVSQATCLSIPNQPMILLKTPKFGSIISRNVRTVGMSGIAHGIARTPRTSVRPRNDQLSSSAIPSPTSRTSTSTLAVNSSVVRTTPQKMVSENIWE